MSQTRPFFYITTPIYYVNDLPHIGHAYTTIAADVLARFKRMDGYEVFFLTGTDEHGQKVERSALEKGVPPKIFVDQVVERFKSLWKILGISYDDFIRTTEPRHIEVVNQVIQKLFEKGDIYLGEYEDWYCTPCETFWTSQQLAEGQTCPTCKRKTEKLKEESYFFRLSRYQEPLLRHLEKYPHFVMPPSKRNEILNVLESGLRDLSISRTSFSWGIPMPDAGLTQLKHVVYVWVDALMNYLSGLDYLHNPHFKNFWPTALHLIGKDILRHHAIYWPALLLALDLPLPRQIFAHGWWTIEGQKMSKSLRNVIDPFEVVQEYGLDAFRYFLLREIPFGQDGDYSKGSLITRVNNDLANDLGNALQRITTMAERFLGGKVDCSSVALQSNAKESQELKERAEKLLDAVRIQIEALSFDGALKEIWGLIGTINRFLDVTAPWKVAKEGDPKKLNQILGSGAEALRISSLVLYPFMPESASKMWRALGIKRPLVTSLYKNEWHWGDERESARELNRPDPLFPRIEESA